MPRTAAALAKPTIPPVEAEDVESTQESGSSLPLISVLDRGAMQDARDMLLEAKEIQERQDRDAVRLKEIKESLCGMAEAYNLKGLRYGTVGLVYSGYQTKRTLDKKLLLENGVDAKTIAISYSESKPFLSARFVKI